MHTELARSANRPEYDRAFRAALQCCALWSDQITMGRFNVRPGVGPVAGFGGTRRGLLLYAQIGDQQRRSPGLYFRQSGTGFGIGILFHSNRLEAHLIGATGNDRHKWLATFAASILNQKIVDVVYVRQLSPADQKILLETGFERIESMPWQTPCHSEDETFCHRIINVSLLFDRDFNITNSQTGRCWRTKLRLAHNRFQNFLIRNRLEWKFAPIRSPVPESVRDLVAEHFEHRSEVVSAEYDQLLNDTHCGSGERTWVGWIGDRTFRRPVSLHFADDLMPAGEITSAAIYLNVATRSILSAGLRDRIRDATGFSALSQFAHAEVFRALQCAGCQVVDLGGSESPELDRFKQQLGAQIRQTHWVVANANSRVTSRGSRQSSCFS